MHHPPALTAHRQPPPPGIRVAISGMFWAEPNVGSGQYLHGLLDGLARAAPEVEVVLLLPSSRARAAGGGRRTKPGYTGGQGVPEGHNLRACSALPPPSAGRPLAVVHVRTPFDGRSANLAKLWFEQVGVPRAAARLGADVLHVPYFGAPLVAPLPVVCSVLDLIPLLLPEYRGRAAVRAYMRLAARAARRADALIALSEATRADLLRYFGCAPERVTITPLAPGPQYHPRDPAAARAEVAARYGVPSPFIYYIGGLDARKNVAMLVRAFGRMRRAGGPPATLAIAGRALGGDPRLFPDLDGEIAAQGLGAAIRRIQVPPEDNPLLYAAAAAFAYPSRYEGFGLPPLEAMACGTPVIAAAATSLPEVVGDAALLVPPDDQAGWAAALWRLLADAGLRAELRARGLRRAAQFDYARTARETAGVYARVARRRR